MFIGHLNTPFHVSVESEYSEKFYRVLWHAAAFARAINMNFRPFGGDAVNIAGKNLNISPTLIIDGSKSVMWRQSACSNHLNNKVGETIVGRIRLCPRYAFPW